jgi:hypothetical protein
MAAKRRTKEQIAEAIELAHALLMQRCRKHVIKAALRRHFNGVLSARSAERYLSRARDMIAAELGRGKAYLRALSLASYEQIVGDPDASARDRINALTRIDKLMGLEARDGQLPPLEVFLSYLPAAMAEQIKQALRDHLRLPREPAAPPAEPPPQANGHSRLPLDPDPPLF